MKLETFIEEDIEEFLEEKEDEQQEKDPGKSRPKEIKMFNLDRDYAEDVQQALEAGEIGKARKAYHDLKDEYDDATGNTKSKIHSVMEEIHGDIADYIDANYDGKTPDDLGVVLPDHQSSYEAEREEQIEQLKEQKERKDRLLTEIRQGVDRIENLLEKDEVMAAIYLYKHLKDSFGRIPKRFKHERKDVYDEIVTSYYQIKRAAGESPEEYVEEHVEGQASSGASRDEIDERIHTIRRHIDEGRAERAQHAYDELRERFDAYDGDDKGELHDEISELANQLQQLEHGGASEDQGNSTGSEAGQPANEAPSAPRAPGASDTESEEPDDQQRGQDATPEQPPDEGDPAHDTPAQHHPPTPPSQDETETEQEQANATERPAEQPDVDGTKRGPSEAQAPPGDVEDPPEPPADVTETDNTAERAASPDHEATADQTANNAQQTEPQQGDAKHALLKAVDTLRDHIKRHEPRKAHEAYKAAKERYKAYDGDDKHAIRKDLISLFHNLEQLEEDSVDREQRAPPEAAMEKQSTWEKIQDVKERAYGHLDNGEPRSAIKQYKKLKQLFEKLDPERKDQLKEQLERLHDAIDEARQEKHFGGGHVFTECREDIEQIKQLLDDGDHEEARKTFLDVQARAIKIDDQDRRDEVYDELDRIKHEIETAGAEA